MLLNLFWKQSASLCLPETLARWRQLVAFTVAPAVLGCCWGALCEPSRRAPGRLTPRHVFARRALDDISESIRELQFYRNNIFKRKTDEKKRKIIENGENEKTVSWCRLSCCHHTVLRKQLLVVFCFPPFSFYWFMLIAWQSTFFSYLASPDYSSRQHLKYYFLLIFCFLLWHSSPFESTRSCPPLGTYLHLLLDHIFCLRK